LVSLLKQIASDIAPFLTKLFNRSLAAEWYTSTFKKAVVTPVIKKPGLNAAQFILPNLEFVDHIKALRMTSHQATYRLPALWSTDLLPSLQFGFRPDHSTETADLQGTF